MYTVEIYKADKRKKSGERLIAKIDYRTDNLSMLEHTVNSTMRKGERYVIHATWVTRTSALTGEPFQERYDTPYYCSASSETYWSN